MSGSPEDCIREKIVIEGENYYIVVGDSFVAVTCPYENRPHNAKTRMVLDMLCGKISDIMKQRSTK